MACWIQLPVSAAPVMMTARLTTSLMTIHQCRSRPHEGASLRPHPASGCGRLFLCSHRRSATECAYDRWGTATASWQATSSTGEPVYL
jgi:hypothetical protein